MFLSWWTGRWTMSVLAPNQCFCSCCSLSCVQLFAPYGLQHTRLPCLSQSPGVCSNSCPLSRWRHPTISSFVIPFSSYPQSFPASGSFQWVMKYYSVIKNEILLFVSTNIDGHRGYYAKWNNSDRERKTLYDFIYMWNLQNKWINITKPRYRSIRFA